MELKKEYLLNGESIDSISNDVNTFLEELKTERKNQLGIRLLVETFCWIGGRNSQKRRSVW